MNVYIFKNVEQLTDNYHSEGGLVVIAENKNHVKELINWANAYNEWEDMGLQTAEIELSEDEWKDVIIYPTNEDAKPDIFVFPDAGCC